MSAPRRLCGGWWHALGTGREAEAPACGHGKADFCGHAAVSAGFTEHKFIADSGLVATRALAFNLPRRLGSTNQVVENICQMYSTSFSTERREREKENEQVVREIVEIAPIHFETTR